MTDFAKIVLMEGSGIQIPTELILEELEKIKKWHNGKDYNIYVRIVNHEFLDSVAGIVK